MKKILMSLAFFLAAIATASNATTMAEQAHDETVKIAKHLPLRIDDLTTLVNIFSDEDSVRYTYRIDFHTFLVRAARGINMTPEQVTEWGLKTYGSRFNWLAAWGDQSLAPAVIKTDCATPSVKKYLMGGFTLVHAYYDVDNSYIYQSKVTIRDC